MSKITIEIEREHADALWRAIAAGAGIPVVVPPLGGPVPPPAPTPELPQPPDWGTPVAQAQEPSPVVYQGPDFGPPDDDGAQLWGFLLGLESKYVDTSRMKVIANFAKLNYGFNEAQARSHEMNVGAAAFNHNIAYRIVESTGVWDRMFGGVKWRNGDVLQGVISFPANVTLDMAKQMLRGRVKRMERATNLRHFLWLDSKDLKEGAKL